MVIPSQDLIKCKTCGESKEPHKTRKLHCVSCARKLFVEYQTKHKEKQKSISRILQCKGCGEDFDAAKTGRVWKCHNCILAYQKDLSEKNAERYNKYSRDYRKKLGDEYRAKMVKRRADAIASMTDEELKQFRKKEAEKSVRLQAVLREQIFSAYGGYKCACCGENEKLFLSIDHIHNNGAEQRKNGEYGRSGTSFYQWLRKNNFPDGFQVLCMNCNMGKHRNGGVCPHQSGKV